jgi:hypothetical protein
MMELRENWKKCAGKRLNKCAFVEDGGIVH